MRIHVAIAGVVSRWDDLEPWTGFRHVQVTPIQGPTNAGATLAPEYTAAPMAGTGDALTTRHSAGDELEGNRSTVVHGRDQVFEKTEAVVHTVEQVVQSAVGGVGHVAHVAADKAKHLLGLDHSKK